MNDILQDISGPALITAFEANLVELFSRFRQWRRAEVYISENILWTITDVPAAFFNSIIRAQLSPNEVDDEIEAAILRGKSRNVPIGWWTGPATRPADLGASLLAHGFVHEWDMPGMAINLSALNAHMPIPPGLVIEEVTDIESLKKWHHAFVVGSGMPDFMGDAFFEVFCILGLDADCPFRHYVGLLNGEPVATSMLFLGAGVAGIYNVATVPEARQKGFGTALTYKALREAHNAGYKVGVLEASKDGETVYRKLGFEEYWKMGHYAWRPNQQNAS
jgi:ribosomal protein S18 acetylase RimI-like enzyme